MSLDWDLEWPREQCTSCLISAHLIKPYLDVTFTVKPFPSFPTPATPALSPLGRNETLLSPKHFLCIQMYHLPQLTRNNRHSHTFCCFPVSSIRTKKARTLFYLLFYITWDKIQKLSCCLIHKEFII